MANARRRTAVALAAAGLLAAASAAEACTATYTLDMGRRARDTDDYRAARDVAEKFVDEEGYLKDEATVEAGTGTLLVEKTALGPNTSSWKNANTWREFLDAEGSCSGIDRNGASITGAHTVRDHMRAHVKEWDVFLRTGVDAYDGYASDMSQYYERDYKGGGSVGTKPDSRSESKPEPEVETGLQPEPESQPTPTPEPNPAPVCLRAG